MLKEFNGLDLEELKRMVNYQYIEKTGGGSDAKPLIPSDVTYRCHLCDETFAIKREHPQTATDARMGIHRYTAPHIRSSKHVFCIEKCVKF